MKTTAQLHEEALEIISRLNTRLANEGDTEAAAALFEIAKDSTEILFWRLTEGHPARPDTQALMALAAKSLEWPVMLPAMGELRAQAATDALPECLGSGLPFDQNRRKKRTFLRDQPNGFAFDIGLVLERARGATVDLPPFGPESKSQWVEAGYQFVRPFKDNPMPLYFVWPINLKSSIDQTVLGEKIDEDAAFKKVIKRKLREGFALLYREEDGKT